MITQVILGVIFFYLLWKSLKKPDNYPPGLWGLPGIGYIPFGNKTYFERVNDLHKEHGDVALWRMGSKLMVYVFDYKMIKDACTKTDFIDRPNNGTLSLLPEYNENAGLVSSNGSHWQNMRRFTLRQMRDLGMGKSKIVAAVHEEARYLVESIRKLAGKPVRLPNAFSHAVLNVIWQMVAGKRYEEGDPVVAKLTRMIDDIQNHYFQFIINGFLPWLSKVIPTFIFDKLFKTEDFNKTRREFSVFMKGFVDEHRETIDYDNQKDFINAYLVEMENQKDDPDSTMSERDLIVTITDLFTAGSESTGRTLQWCTLYLCNYPEVQKKLQKCVDDVLPKGTLPLLDDKPRLPYVEAFIHEIQRHATFTPNGVMHEAVHDTKLGGYFIPKGALLSAGFYSCHFDQRFWKNPQEFNPDRFLDENGKCKHVTEGFLPFGIGKRTCVGEALARVELFIFVTAIVQKFNFSPPPGKVRVNLEPISHPLICIPSENQKIIIAER